MADREMFGAVPAPLVQGDTRIRTVVRRLPWTYWALIAFLLMLAAQHVVGVAADLPRLAEVGYGDSYIWYDVEHYRQTGTIFRNLANPPYNPTIYSPLLYMALASPPQWISARNPFLGPRLVVLLFFAACTLVTLSITKKLLRHRLPVAWSLLLMVSITLLGLWLLQLRVDFMGIAFSLCSIRLLMSRWRLRFAAAGIAAGIAFLFKATFLAAIVSGLLWLLVRRRFRGSVEFTAAAAAVCLGGYAWFVFQEPRMLEHFRLLRAPIVDLHGYRRVVFEFLREPVTLLAISVLPLLLHRMRTNWGLILTFAGVSLCIALSSALQAGANTNYFFECLFALVPVACFGILRLCRRQQFSGVADRLCALSILVALILPNSWSLSWEVARARPSEIAADNGRVAALWDTLRDAHVLALVPWVAAVREKPLLTEPFLVRFLSLAGKFDVGPLAARIQRGEFAALVINEQPLTYRGLDLISPEFSRAAKIGYAPFCTYRDLLFQLPVEGSHGGAVGPRLLTIGCTPVTAR